MLYGAFDAVVCTAAPDVQFEALGRALHYLGGEGDAVREPAA